MLTLDKVSFLKQQLLVCHNTVDLLDSSSADFAWAHLWAVFPRRDGWAEPW